MTDDNGSVASYFETLLGEAAGPFVVHLDDDGPELVIGVPAAADVADLDTTASVHDLLDLLVGEELADVIADHFARRPISELADLVDDIREHFGILIPPDTGWAYLVSEIDRYGDAIEKDFFAMPGDERLYDWVRDHLDNPWNRLLRLLSALPEGGWYYAAIADDDERAMQRLEMEQRGELPKPSKRPSLVGWTHDRELLTEAVESLAQILHGVWGASPKFKGKGGKPPGRRPRPQTARDRAEEYQALVEHDDISSQVLGGRYKRRIQPQEVFNG
ncbi:hypothetical protein FND50_25065 [Rhodococcus sp. WB9]|uniref:hypothetical protein n=1 Tax=Rhodococcus sp. WB9 TaxID=2594007 RepID=UPI001186FE0E|nr:hypothetical protein [Rhodococcus sp. WB9]QDQ93702.1 hypothetical protein FND50_25065 [Rhodococcus sp. WB9]